MERIFKKLGIFIEKRRLLIIVVTLALIVPSIFAATQVEMKTGRDTMVSPDSKVYKDLERFNQDFSSDVVIILLSGDNLTQLLQADNVMAMESLENQLSGNPQIVSIIGPAFLIKQAVAQQTGIPELPDDLAQLEGIVIDPDSGEIRTEFKQVFPDNKHALITITLDGDLSPDEQKEVIEEAEHGIADSGFEKGIEITVTGLPVFLNGVTDSLGGSMRNMLLLSLGIMILVLTLIFSVRGFFAWRWLPLGAILIAIVYAFGAMGILSIPITMVTMSAFPILIGLGVDYAIQFHNRYDEEGRRGKTPSAALIDSVIHVGPTIGIAIIAACLGFAALFFSPVPMIHGFGLTLILGIIAAYLLSLFFLLAILYWRDRSSKPVAEFDDRNKKPGKQRVHVLDKSLRHIAPWVIKNPAIILPIALLACVGGMIADFHIETESDQLKYISTNVPYKRDLLMAESVLGGVSSINVFIEGDVAYPVALKWMLQVEQRIKEEQSDEVVIGITSVADLVMQATGGTIPDSEETINDILEEMSEKSPQIKRNLITDDYTAANMVITLPDLPIDQLEDLKDQLIDYTIDPPDGLEVTVTGASVISIELNNALTGGRVKMTMIGSALVFIGLFLLFKFNVFRAFIAILPIALILGWTGGMMFLFGIKHTPLTATLGALSIGIGVEFTVLLMMRYYEERSKGEGVVEAMTTAITNIGRAIIASGFTVIGGFGALLVATDFPIIQEFGIITLMNVFFALMGTLFVLATLVVLIDRRRERKKELSIQEKL